MEFSGLAGSHAGEHIRNEDLLVTSCGDRVRLPIFEWVDTAPRYPGAQDTCAWQHWSCCRCCRQPPYELEIQTQWTSLNYIVRAYGHTLSALVALGGCGWPLISHGPQNRDEHRQHILHARTEGSQQDTCSPEIHAGALLQRQPALAARTRGVPIARPTPVQATWER